MSDKVKEILKQLETKHNVDILFAVEAGSRAWGFESPDSDFDIRFVFKQKDYRKYLGLNEPTETIDGFSEDRLYDWQGWDIKKALKLLRQSNPSLAEWLYTPIVYHDDGKFSKIARKLLEQSKQLKPLLYHYRSMAKSNYKKHIFDNQEVSCKKYLYVIRPAAMVFWLLKVRERNYLEIQFEIILNDIKPLIDNELYECILKQIENKKLMIEKDKCERIKCIDDWLDGIVLDTKEFDVKEGGDEAKIKVEDCDKLLFEYLGVA